MSNKAFEKWDDNLNWGMYFQGHTFAQAIERVYKEAHKDGQRRENERCAEIAAKKRVDVDMTSAESDVIDEAFNQLANTIRKEIKP